MRWLFGSATALFLVWAAYVASPYIAAIRLVAAIATGDGAALTERVNLRAVRAAVAKQIVDQGLAEKGQGTVSSSDIELIKGTITAAAEPFLTQTMTPPGVAGLIGLGSFAAPFKGGPLAALTTAPRQVLAIVQASRWRGFRNVYLTLPPEKPAGEQTRLQMRLSRLTWRLVGIDLPPGEKARLVAAVLAKRDGLVGTSRSDLPSAAGDR